MIEQDSPSKISLVFSMRHFNRIFFNIILNGGGEGHESDELGCLN